MRISDWSSDVCSSDLSPTTYLTQWRVADSRAESMRMRSGAEIARYDRTACSIAGHRANEWAGCASCSKLIVPPIDTTMRQKHSARGIHIDRKSVEKGKSVSVRVDLGGLGIIKKK